MRRACAILVCVAMTLATMARVRLWTAPDAERRLWAEAVAHSPAKPRPWINLGVQYVRLRQHGLAAFTYQTAIALASRPERAPDEQTIGRAIAEANLALVRLDQGGGADAVYALLAASRRARVASILEAHAWVVRRGTP